MRRLVQNFFLTSFFWSLIRNIPVWHPEWHRIHTEEDLIRSYPWHFNAENLKSLSTDSPIQRDWTFVRRRLFPTWMELDYHARYHAQVFYRYQYLFIVSVVLTILCGIFMLANEVAQVQTTFAVLGIIFSLLAFASLAAGNRPEIRRRWTRSNMLADNLDRVGFMFLLRIPPYHDSQRATRLVSLINQTRAEYPKLELVPPLWQLDGLENLSGNELADNVDTNSLKIAFAAYIKYRREMSMRYLHARIERHEHNLQITMIGSLIALIFSAICATAVAVLTNTTSNAVSIFESGVAVFPLVVVFFFLFRSIYNWERSNKFKEGIQVLSEYVTTEWEPETYPEIVNRIESVIARVYLRDDTVEAIDDSHLGDDSIRVNPLFGIPPDDKRYQCDVFVVMPFNDDMNPIFDEQIAPALEKINLRVKRADSIHTSYSLMTDIWAFICASRIVIVECSQKNTNVYYELGITHTLGKPYILLIQSGSKLPSDLNGLRYMEYDPTPEGVSRLGSELQEKVGSLLRLSL